MKKEWKYMSLILLLFIFIKTIDYNASEYPGLYTCNVCVLTNNLKTVINKTSNWVVTSRKEPVLDSVTRESVLSCFKVCPHTVDTTELRTWFAWPNEVAEVREATRPMAFLSPGTTARWPACLPTRMTVQCSDSCPATDSLGKGSHWSREEEARCEAGIDSRSSPSSSSPPVHSPASGCSSLLRGV